MYSKIAGQAVDNILKIRFYRKGTQVISEGCSEEEYPERREGKLNV